MGSDSLGVSPETAAAFRRALFTDLSDPDLDVDLCLTSFPRKREAITAPPAMSSFPAPINVGARRNAEQPIIQRMPITKELAGTLKGLLGETLRPKAAAVNAKELVLRPYVPMAKLEPHEVEVLDLRAYPSVKAQVAALSSMAALDAFTAEDAFVAGLRYSAVVLHVPEGPPVCVFRSMNAKRELQRSKFLGIVLKGGAFHEVSDEVYLLDMGVDCMSCGDLMFIFQKAAFQTIFRFFEEIKRTARETLEVLRRRDLIDGFDAFEQACLGHLQMAAKVHNAATAGYFPDLTVEHMKEVAQQFHRKIEFRPTNGRERAVFNPADKWELLRLLDDDLLRSPLTQLKYEVNSKRVV